MESLYEFRRKLMWQKHFARRPKPNCWNNCYDPHPKVQALVAANEATTSAKLQDMTNSNTYAYREAHDE